MTSEQTKRFKYWQMRTIIATMVGYALFYFVRKNFSLAMPGLEADLGISKTSLGIFLTLNGLIYGFSRFANGILADRMNARWYMAVGLALCALANFAFGFGEDVSYWITGEHSGDQFGNTMILFMGVMWVVNGLLQGTGFPPCARLLTHWIPPTELATKMSVWNTSHSIGAGLVVILCGYIMGTLGTNMAGDPDAVASIAANLGVSPDDAAGMERVMTSAAHVGAWKWCFWIPSAIAFAGAIGLVVFLRDTPTSVGLPELEGTETRQVKTEKKGAEHKAFLMKYVFKNPLIWILGFANFFVYIVRFSVLDWGPSLLSSRRASRCRTPDGSWRCSRLPASSACSSPAGRRTSGSRAVRTAPASSAWRAPRCSSSCSGSCLPTLRSGCCSRRSAPQGSASTARRR